MLDKQFFRDEQFHPFLSDQFILFRAHRGDKHGDEIYQKFSVRATPTVMFTTADGKEIDRLVGYDSPPENFKTRIEETLNSDNTLLKLNQAYEANPTDINILAKLTHKYYSHYNLTGMIEFGAKVLDQPGAAKKVFLSVEKDKPEVMAYEFAKFTTTYNGPEEVLAFADEFPKSEMLDQALGNFGRTFYNKAQVEKALEVFEKLIAKFPDSANIVGAYVGYCTRNKSDLERASKLAGRVFKANSGKVDFGFAIRYTELLMETGDEAGLKDVIQKIIEANSDYANNFQMQVGFIYQNRKEYDNAFAYFEEIVKSDPSNYAALYQIGRTAVYSGQNLDRGIESLKTYLQHEPEEGDPSKASAYWRMGMLYKLKTDKKQAKKSYEQALKLDPDYAEAKKALEDLDKK